LHKNRGLLLLRRFYQAATNFSKYLWISRIFRKILGISGILKNLQNFRNFRNTSKSCWEILEVSGVSRNFKDFLGISGIHRSQSINVNKCK
jgi:hypothetical protein